MDVLSPEHVEVGIPISVSNIRGTVILVGRALHLGKYWSVHRIIAIMV